MSEQYLQESNPKHTHTHLRVARHMIYAAADGCWHPQVTWHTPIAAISHQHPAVLQVTALKQPKPTCLQGKNHHK